MTEIEIPPLAPEATREIVQTYIARQGMLIEAPGLFVGHVVKQSGGNPQAIADLLDDSAKERLVDKRKIREMRHAAGVRYFDFTPVLIVALASVVGARYLAIGTGDTELYIFAGMRAAVVISIRVFLFRGVAAAGLSRPPARRAVPPRPSASRWRDRSRRPTVGRSGAVRWRPWPPVRWRAGAPVVVRGWDSGMRSAAR
jgi:hypothetical protein